MRVLLISANQEQSPDPVAPLGVCYVATAAAAAGHDVEVLDLCFVSDVEHAVREAVGRVRPDAIGLSLRNVDNCAYPDTVSYLPHYRRIVDACRAVSDAPLVLGGSAFTTMPQHYLETLAVPHGIVGEGELAFVELLARLAAREDPASLPGVASWTPGTGVRRNPPAWLPSPDAVTASRRWIDLAMLTPGTSQDNIRGFFYRGQREPRRRHPRILERLRRRRREQHMGRDGRAAPELRDGRHSGVQGLDLDLQGRVRARDRRRAGGRDQIGHESAPRFGSAVLPRCVDHGEGILSDS